MALVGSPPTRPGTGQHPCGRRDADALGHRGRLAVRDALVDAAHVVRRPHVAIDRVSGGARDQALFSVELVDEGRLRLVVDSLEEPPSWATGLLLAAGTS